MNYVTNPIRNEKSKLAFRGIIIRENYRQAQISKRLVELEKEIKEISKWKESKFHNG